jgi:UDP-N-acetyl-D-galactosamine dehydrogenase
VSLQNTSIAIIGLGYVGLPLAVEFGKHRSVRGFDINQARIDELQGDRDNTLEVTSADLAGARRLTYSSRREDLADYGICLGTVPTPIDKANRPDLTPLVKASETVGTIMKPGSLVIYESTVYPGCTDEVCVPVLERFSGLKFNEGFFSGGASRIWFKA